MTLCMLLIMQLTQAQQAQNAHVIHFEAGEFVTQEAQLAPGQSVEDLLSQLNIDAQNLSVIQLGEPGSPEVWVIPREDAQGYVIELDENGVQTTISGNSENGELIIQKFESLENGENVQIIELDGERNVGDINVEEILEEQGIVLPEGDDVVIKTMIIEKNEFIELSDETSEGEENVEQDIQIFKSVGPDGQEETQIWINGEEATEEDLADFEIIELDMTHKYDSGDFLNELNELNETIVILTPVGMEKNATDSGSKLVEDLTFAPNPSDGLFTVSFDLPSKKKTFVKVLDMNGRVVEERSLGKVSGKQVIDFDLSQEAAGTYFFNVIQGDDKIVERIIIR